MASDPQYGSDWETLIANTLFGMKVALGVDCGFDPTAAYSWCWTRRSRVGPLLTIWDQNAISVIFRSKLYLKQWLPTNLVSLSTKNGRPSPQKSLRPFSNLLPC